ncbi:hypothetical protein LQ318_13360 [Aliifodinibius salicampi]|uniref:WD40-like Beta Propeller Repeat n=1 Tax=Fodinibius salicampi TaxID=1920655 RepID=A0ABT3Q1C4_9BACT|nr:hypothetical protein [Fodinibius salicampi]MCW9713893.1 hypothetical protein [Fodinibius salicampi]
MRNFLVLLLLFCGICTYAQAQFYTTQYRPPQQLEQLRTPHFKIVYATGNDSIALRTGQILEEQYGSVQKLVGGELNDFPVILNDYNDRSNGFVTSHHFRSEIEFPPIKGKSLNPQTGGWLENVVPHELVHALQYSNLGSNNLPQFISLFSPDVARSFHGAIPSGINEGLAVYHETKSVSAQGGRGNFPLFTNQFKATFKSNRRWSMGQMLQRSSDTRPFNRHYIGGYAFTNWLHQNFGENISRETLSFYMNYPFLGYGAALRHTTGKWPGQLYDQLVKDKQKTLRGPSSSYQTLSIPFKGREIRRPKWLSDSTLVFYGSFYNARPGFYRYDLDSEEIKRILTTNSVGDYRYDLSGDRSKMIFGYYQADPIYDNTTKAELLEFDFSTNTRKQITKGGRVYAPTYVKDDELWALQTRPASSAITSVTADSISEVFSRRDYEITAVTAHPKSHQHQIAIIANKDGNQALWIARRSQLSQELHGTPDVSFKNGSVFDPEWHPDENKLLFSSDFTGIQQLYEFNLDENTIREMTNTPFNAFEGSYSPDGQRIAFIRQHKNERLPAILNQSDFLNKTIEPDKWQTSETTTTVTTSPVVSDSVYAQSKHWETDTYTTGGRWLKPRTILPSFKEVGNSNNYQAGFALHSNSLLADQSYSAEFTYFKDRSWYEITYQNKSFFPGFKAKLYSEPDYLAFEQEDRGLFTLLRQNRALSLSIPLNVRLNNNIYSSSVYIEPEIRYSQIRFFDTREELPSSDFSDLAVANLYSQFNIRLQQNIRDVQPNTGITLFSEIEHYLSDRELSFAVNNGEIQLTQPQSTALRAGMFSYFSPLRRWNQSFRVGLQGLTQSGLIFNNQSLVSDGFSEKVLPTANNLLSLSTRYTIPLAFADNGGFLLPFYLKNLYLVAFSNSVTSPASTNWYERSRSVFGLQLRMQFRISNLSFDIGAGYGYEPTRKNHQFFIDSF